MTRICLTPSELWSPPTSAKEPQDGIIPGLPGSFFPLTPFGSSPVFKFTPTTAVSPCNCTERDGWGFCKHSIPEACLAFEQSQGMQPESNEQPPPSQGGVPEPLTLATPLPPGAYRGWSWGHTPPKTPVRSTFPDMASTVAPQAGSTAAAIQKPRIFVEDWGSPMVEGSTVLYESDSESEEVCIKRGGMTDSPLGFKARVAAAQQARPWSRTQSAFMPKKRPNNLRRMYPIRPSRTTGPSKADAEAPAQGKSPLQNKTMNKGKGQAKAKSSHKIRSSASASRILAIKARASPAGKVVHDALFSARGRGATRFSFSGVRRLAGASPLKSASTSGWQMRTVPESPAKDDDEDEDVDGPPSPCSGRGQTIFPFARKAASTGASSPGLSTHEDSLTESEDECESEPELEAGPSSQPAQAQAGPSKSKPMKRAERLLETLSAKMQAEYHWSNAEQSRLWLIEQQRKQEEGIHRAVMGGLGLLEVSQEGSSKATEESAEDRWARAKPWAGVKMGKVNGPAQASRSLWPEDMRLESERQVGGEEETMEDHSSSDDSAYDVGARFYNKEEHEDEVVEAEDRNHEEHVFTPYSPPPPTP